ncbi:hypothetical protein K2173_002849 [Erythroxylum novogranatense]|uniref:Palmitoyl-protein thioesterase 1 n=1 Tax=Erythroxylum novogranatense TaxID=1862640 RepID=A0AAV8SQZ5_9ROSI|nr:hypothetical protein K2173_002849 [Erythroxylum novogranatense]
MAFAFEPLYSHCILVLVSLTSLVVPFASPLPFVYFHGITDYCASAYSFALTQALQAFSGSPGSCVEIGNGFSDSFAVPLMEQTNIACEKIKSMPELAGGYNIVGVSQGNMVARGVIELCDGPPVRNFVSVGGPNAGEAAVAPCVSSGVYSEFVQANSAPAGYTKIPYALKEYLEGCKFLPIINNELPGQFNPLLKQRFSNLSNLMLIMFEQDAIIIPKESSLFGFYEDGSTSTVLPMQQTNIYIQDLFGLKTLDEAGKIKTATVPGIHVQLTPCIILQYIVPYL